MKTSLENQWHHLSSDEVVDRLETTVGRGLDGPEVERRTRQLGPNALAVPKGKSPLLLFAQQFNQPLVYILLVGITGTEVAKEASDMLLTDDNFSSIAATVKEGRGVYNNLVKCITWNLPTNLGEGLVILAAVFAGTQLPILPVQILWINMTTAVLLGLILAFEPKEPGIMDQLPRDPAQSLLTGELISRICLVGFLLLLGAFGLFEWVRAQGRSLEAARTCAVNVFVFGELFYLFNCRSLRSSPFRIGFTGNRPLLAARRVK